MTSLYVSETGPAEAPTLVFLHGGGGSGWMWTPQVAAPFGGSVAPLPGSRWYARWNMRCAARVPDACFPQFFEDNHMNTWQTFFDHYAPRYLQEGFTRNTAAEVDYLIEALPLPPGASVLDLGCGVGRHSVALAQRGYRVTGLDLSSGMLAEAERAARAAEVAITWVQANAALPTPAFLERLGPAAPFDAGVCLCEGAFGLIGQEEDPEAHDLTILHNVAAVLRPGAPFLLTALNGLRLIRLYQQADVEAGRFDPWTLTETHPMEYDTPEGPQTVMVREKGHLPQDLARLCRTAGFEVEHVWGGTAGNWGRRPVELDEIELMILARRR
jgi:cyclopropane fatty-acyl-phospholipid synthase-like methyltransferase